MSMQFFKNARHATLPFVYIENNMQACISLVRLNKLSYSLKLSGIKIKCSS